VSSSAEHEGGAAVRSNAERLAFDRSSQDVAHTRRIAIGATVIGAALLAGLARTWWAYGIALLSLVAVRFWARRVTSADAEQRALEGRAIELDDEGLSIPRADGETTHVSWSALDRVEIDHERLLVVLRQRDGSEAEIEPTFGGLGLDALARRIEARRPAQGPRTR
jgi:hypothetical protein